MRKIKLKLTGNDVIELCEAITQAGKHLENVMKTSPKEINVYRMFTCMKLFRRMQIVSLKVTVGKYSILSFDLNEQITLRYILLNSKRTIRLNTIYTQIDRVLHPSMFERHETH